MIPEFFKNRIEYRFGKPILYAKDCDELANSVMKICDNSISSSTLKRVFNLGKCVKQPRNYTLDLLARYAELGSWSLICHEDILTENCYYQCIDNIAISKLATNSIIRIVFASLDIIDLLYKDNNNFLVLETSKNKLIKGDMLHILHVEKLFPLVCENVMRLEKNLGAFIGCRNEIIKNLSIEPPVE